MNWLINIFDSIKWKIEDAVWAIQDTITLHKELKSIDKEWDAELDQVEGISGAWQEEKIKPKKKKAKKKSARKTKKSV